MCLFTSPPFFASQSLLFRSVFSLLALPGSPGVARRKSQSLLFRSVFSLRCGPDRRHGLRGDVAIPSIQVGFFTQRRMKMVCKVCGGSQSLLFRSVFSLTLASGVSVHHFVAIPSIQVGFFTRILRKPFRSIRFGRNPFYSGRFFHSMGLELERAAERDMVAIPSIQVGFFTSLWTSRRGSRRWWRSQSLLFRSVFSLLMSRVRRRTDIMSQSLLFRSVFSLGREHRDTQFGGKVAIPSIQVGFFTQRL